MGKFKAIYRQRKVIDKVIHNCCFNFETSDMYREKNLNWKIEKKETKIGAGFGGQERKIFFVPNFFDFLGKPIREKKKDQINDHCSNIKSVVFKLFDIYYRIDLART